MKFDGHDLSPGPWYRLVTDKHGETHEYINQDRCARCGKLESELELSPGPVFRVAKVDQAAKTITVESVPEETE